MPDLLYVMRGPLLYASYDERTYCMAVMMRGPIERTYFMPVMMRGPIVCQL